MYAYLQRSALVGSCLYYTFVTFFQLLLNDCNTQCHFDEQLEIESNSCLNDFGRSLKDVVDEKLIEHIGAFKSNESCTNVERLMNFSSSSIIEMLDKSPPELYTALKIFLNRCVPDTLRPYIWSYTLQLKTTTVDVVSV